MEIKTIGVVGAGQMGSGIAQVAAASGLAVLMNDIKDEFLEKGFAAIEKNLGRMVKKEKISEEDQKNIHPLSKIRALPACSRGREYHSAQGTDQSGL